MLQQIQTFSQACPGAALWSAESWVLAWKGAPPLLRWYTRVPPLEWPVPHSGGRLARCPGPPPQRPTRDWCAGGGPSAGVRRRHALLDSRPRDGRPAGERTRCIHAVCGHRSGARGRPLSGQEPVSQPGLGCTRFTWMRDTNKSYKKEHRNPPAYHCKTSRAPGMCRHLAAMGGGTLDGVGGTPSFGEERIPPQSRIKRSLSVFWCYRYASKSALSEMFVFDHDLNPPFGHHVQARCRCHRRHH